MSPPLTPRGVLLRHPALVWVVAGAAVALGVAAHLDGGAVLAVVDEPVERWVVANRTPAATTVFRGFSRLGSNLVVFGAFALIVAATARRCRSLALSLGVAVLARPVFELAVKELVGRERPALDRLVDGTGPSFPSGHVLAAVTLWGLLPPLVALMTDRRWVWVASVAASAVLIGGISASRIYLGVHWLTDVVGGLLIGWLYLTVIETIYVRHHHGRHCRGATGVPAPADGSAGALGRR